MNVLYYACTYYQKFWVCLTAATCSAEDVVVRVCVLDCKTEKENPRPSNGGLAFSED